MPGTNFRSLSELLICCAPRCELPAMLRPRRSSKLWSEKCEVFQRHRTRLRAQRRECGCGSEFDLPNNPALARLDELHDLPDFFALRQFLANGFQRLSGIIFRAVNQSERFLD